MRHIKDIFKHFKSKPSERLAINLIKKDNYFHLDLLIKTLKHDDGSFKSKKEALTKLFITPGLIIGNPSSTLIHARVYDALDKYHLNDETILQLLFLGKSFEYMVPSHLLTLATAKIEDLTHLDTAINEGIACPLGLIKNLKTPSGTVSKLILDCLNDKRSNSLKILQYGWNHPNLPDVIILDHIKTLDYKVDKEEILEFISKIKDSNLKELTKALY